MLGAIWQDDKLMGIIAGFFFALAMVLLGYASVQWFINRPFFELRTVKLVGQVERVNLIGFRSQVLPQVKGSFFSANLQDIRKAVESQPWVRKASIQRAWPNGLSIQIEEHQPLAAWGESQLVNTFGEVFSANLAEVAEDKELAQLSGPAGSELLVSTLYITASDKLRALGLWPARIRLSDRYAWAIETDSGLKIELGRDQEGFSVENKLDRLVKVLPRIQKEVMPRLSSVDLRYPRGVSIKGEKLVLNGAATATGTTVN